MQNENGVLNLIYNSLILCGPKKEETNYETAKRVKF